MRIIRLVLVGVTLGLPVLAHAQEAAFIGRVTDSTGSVLPGASITAVHEASGNAFESVTDGTGTYRMPVRVGRYRVTAQLPGFTTIVREGLDLLVGREATVNFQLEVSALQETLTVTAESPLLDLTRSSTSGNVDPRQVAEIPVQGRDWQDLTMLAPGSRANSVNEWAIERVKAGNGQLNVDGQQVTNNVIYGGGRGQPSYSRDAIAEFQYVANRFDATQGRSTEVQINVITKSGTNIPIGTFGGYFRSDKWSAADPVIGEVLPYSNQQLSTTFGGPIQRDKMHVFANYEFERQPDTYVHTTPYPAFNLSLQGTSTQHKAGLRTDYQFSSKTRLSVRGNEYRSTDPYFVGGGATVHPSQNMSQTFRNHQFLASLNQVLNSSTFNEIKGGFSRFGWLQKPYAHDPRPSAAISRNYGAPSILLQNITLGNNNHQDIYQDTFQIRDDLSFSFRKRGRHDIKIGGEYIYNVTHLWACTLCNGTIDARGGPPPANLEAIFPVWDDPTTWNLNALSSITRIYTLGVGDMSVDSARHVYAGWLQDDWKITDRLTLNLGVRYDLARGVFAEEVEVLPFLPGGRRSDINNIAPRLGFAFAVNDRTVIRGGGGTFFAEITDQAARFTRRINQQFQFQLTNDGRPDFAGNPFNGPIPSIEAALSSGAATRSVPSQFAAPDMVMPYSHQGSFGVQRQIGNVIGIEADYVWIGGRSEPLTRNINLAYDAETGVNYPNTDASRRPFPAWGNIIQFRHHGWSNYHGLQMALTKRMSNNWQASATYLLSAIRDADPSTRASGCEYVYTLGGACNVPVTVVPDLGEQYTLAASDQRHRATFNAIGSLPYGFQLSGLYFYGSGLRGATTYGGDLRRTGEATAGSRLRPDGSVVDRNAFVYNPVHRVDLRVQRRFAWNRRNIDALLEVYNAFNRANYGSFVTVESNAQYGKPQQSNNVAFSPRRLQLGLRATF